MIGAELPRPFWESGFEPAQQARPRGEFAGVSLTIVNPPSRPRQSASAPKPGRRWNPAAGKKHQGLCRNHAGYLEQFPFLREYQALSACSWLRAAGRLTVTVVPRASALTMLSAPPCNSVKARAMDRPSPAPRICAPANRRADGTVPWPRQWFPRHADAGVGHREADAAVGPQAGADGDAASAGVNLIALETRLPSAWPCAANPHAAPAGWREYPGRWGRLSPVAEQAMGNRLFGDFLCRGQAHFDGELAAFQS